jgi:putative transposase
MKKKRFSREQILGVLKQAEVGVPAAEVIRKAGISEQTFYRWKAKYVGLEVDQVRPMRWGEDNGHRKHALREVINAVRYGAKTGCPWRWVPGDLPPWATVYQQMRRWLAAGCTSTPSPNDDSDQEPSELRVGSSMPTFGPIH